MSEDEDVTLLGLNPDMLPLEGHRLNVAIVLLSTWFIIGVTWDFGVHIQGISFEEEGFITAPHVMFYSGAFAVGLVMMGAVYLNRKRGSTWIEGIPTGYGYGLIGVLLFALGGPMDFVWHNLFGAEDGLEALTSPTHLLLAVGAALFLGSPLRASWIIGVGERLRKQIPMLVSAGFIAIAIAAFGMYANPIAEPVAGGGWLLDADTGEVSSTQHGVLMIASFSALITGLTLVLLTRFNVALGGFTVMYTVISLPFVAGSDLVFLPVMALGGLSADLLNKALSPSVDNTKGFRAFSAFAPLVLFSLYFLAHELAWGVAWSIHIWTGAITVAVLIGVLMGYAIHPFGGEVSGE